MKTPRFLPMTAYLRTFALVVALLLPPTPVAAADPASSSGRIASPQSETLTTPQKAITAAGLKTPLPQRAPGNAETLAPAPAQGQDADASVRPAGAPVYVALRVERAVLRVGETAIVTVSATSEAALDGVEVWLKLPAGLVTTTGEQGTLRWPAAELAGGQPFSRSVDVTVEKPKQALKRGVVRLEATAHTAGGSLGEVSTLLGVASEEAGSEGESLTDETEQGDEGSLLVSPEGDVTLLAGAGAVTTGATLRYTQVHHWQTGQVSALPNETPLPTSDEPAQVGNDETPDDETPDDETSTDETPITVTPSGVQHAYLPLVSSDAEAFAATTAEEITTTEEMTAAEEITTTESGPQPMSSANVDAYAIWQLDAEENGQEVEEFAGDVELVVSGAELAEAGVDLERLSLWTREHEGELWTELSSHFDSATQSWRAWLPHFSQFSLAEGLTVYSQLPSVRAFSVDKLSGAATLNIPLETPAGRGGMQPNLSLSYSSMGVDEMFRNNGPNAFRAEASQVGLGWGLAGLSYIVRTGGSLDNNTPWHEREFMMALNGQFVRIKYEDGAWHTDPEIFVKVEWEHTSSNGAQDFSPWIITTPDGTKYTFGDTGAFVPQSTTSATATSAQRTNGGNYYRLSREWHLARVEDPQGNVMLYGYKQEHDWVRADCVNNISEYRWYSRAIYPQFVVWNGHTSGLDTSMMVWFTYTGDRLDYKVSGWESDDCTATKFTPSYMTSVDVQVWDQGGLWQTLRRYELGTGYSAGVSNDSANCKNSNNYCVRLLLNELQVKGKHGGLLQRYVTPPVKGLLSKVERALSICWSGYPVGKYDPA